MAQLISNCFTFQFDTEESSKTTIHPCVFKTNWSLITFFVVVWLMLFRQPLKNRKKKIKNRSCQKFNWTIIMHIYNNIAWRWFFKGENWVINNQFFTLNSFFYTHNLSIRFLFDVVEAGGFNLKRFIVLRLIFWRFFEWSKLDWVVQFGLVFGSSFAWNSLIFWFLQ